MSAGSFDHTPVMIEEVVALFAKVPDGVIVDATIGGAGHAGALLGTRPKLSLLGLDADADAVAAASVRLEHFGDRAQVVRARFDEIAEIVHRLGIAPISGVFFDLGVSSHQFDTPDRGFSYRHDAPLDMRMDQRASRTAADLINDTSMEELTQLFRSNGERFARRIARRVVDARPVTRTGQLVEIIRDAIPAPARRVGGHPAKKVFQALRIAVNEELDVLAVALDASLDILGPGGRCVVLSYHSGEDQLVKQRFAKAESGGCSCPSQLPCGCGAVSRGVALTRGARLPRVEETERNPRSQSARLRAFERRFQTGEN